MRVCVHFFPSPHVQHVHGPSISARDWWQKITGQKLLGERHIIIHCSTHRHGETNLASAQVITSPEALLHIDLYTVINIYTYTSIYPSYSASSV